jgi:hypothetical protein
MNKNLTLDDLILFAYDECGTKKPEQIINAICKNEEFIDEYYSIVKIKQELDSIQEEPSERTINNILNYSKALNVFKCKPDVGTNLVIVN